MAALPRMWSYWGDFITNALQWQLLLQAPLSIDGRIGYAVATPHGVASPDRPLASDATRILPNELPRPPHVTLLGTKLRHLQPQRVQVAQPRVRQEDLARGVDRGRRRA